MKAVIAHEYGPPESFALEERDMPAPGPGKIRIAVGAAGVSFVDVLIAEGRYQVKPPLPFVPGTEFAGVVDAVGDGVTTLKVGDRVACSTFGGAFASYAVIPAAAAVLCPDSMTLAEAAVFRVSYSTAYYALKQRGRLAAGETVLVLGAGGAVGAAAVQVAKALGARVIGSASSEAKRQLALQCGADAVVDARADDWREQINALTSGGGVDVVVDPVGGPAAEAAFRVMAWEGRFLVIGFAAGTIPRLPLNLPLLKGAEVVGVDVRQFGERDPEGTRRNLDELFALHAQGKLRPAIAATLPMAEFAAAMNLVKSGEAAGRVVLTVD